MGKMKDLYTDQLEAEYEKMVEEQRRELQTSAAVEVLQELVSKFEDQRKQDISSYGTRHAAVKAWDTAIFLAQRAIELKGGNNL